jgi:hypothetical protein
VGIFVPEEVIPYISSCASIILPSYIYTRPAAFSSIKIARILKAYYTYLEKYTCQKLGNKKSYLIY